MNRLSLSLIICTRNRINDILNLFKSIKEQTVQPDEIIIVDSSDKKLNYIDKFNQKFNNNFFKKSKLIYRHTKPGLPYQRNIGISLSSSDLISFTDDDIIFESDYINEIKKIFVKYPKYGGGMGAIININKKKWTIYKSFRRFFMLQVEHSNGKYTLSGMPTHPFGINKFLEVNVLNGCATYKANILKKFKVDEKLGKYAWMEDCDLSKRISDRYPLFYNPNAKLIHMHSSSNRDSIIKNHSEFIKNYSYLFFKNFYPKQRWRLLFYLWSMFGLFIESVVFSIIFTPDYFKGYFRGIINYYANKNCIKAS